MTTDIALNIVLLSFMAIVGLAIARLRNLFPVAMLTGLYSLLSASLFTLLDAVDVALTEAAVGAGVTTVLFLATFGLTRAREKPVPRSRTLIGLAVTVLTGAVLVYASLDMPHFGAADTPVQEHPLRDRYLNQMSEEIDVPNTVTAVLGSYRGYDTLGEVVVVFTAGIGVLMLLGVAWHRPRKSGKREQ
ncbi:putative multicomponent Na+-H+ antiporter subunit A [Salinisphaera shabanensis T35B1]|uniref:DUF4040 domain-containing protein n=1 Tax=Salinisphaera shabanensis TaxID=180542 RepID=UPI00333F89B6